MTDALKVTVTNTTDGPKIFNGIMPALLHPNQKTGPIEVTEAELKSMRSTGYFNIDGGEEAADERPVSLTGKNKAELLEIAADEGVETAQDNDGKDVPIADATNAQITAAIEAKRAAE